ncbi:MAG: quinolinate phosphoribosyl transferase, partial [Proteobacteria bacterium]|nr:quinolinate phosphoribosyl transferase [Pseudomonadota bacterium]
MQDIRDDIFRDMADRRVRAEITAKEKGIVAETGSVRTSAEELGLSVEHIVDQGSPVEKGDVVARFSGNPKQIAMAEERLIGLMAKASGIATAARRFVERAGPDIQIVSG